MVGAGTGDVFSAFAGGVLGLLVGLSVHAVRWMASRVRETTPTVERHSVMCFPYAQAADCEFVGDLRTGRWTDIRRCSLLGKNADCEKVCIRLMNQTGVRPSPSNAPDSVGSVPLPA